ncbi:MAG: hypothetical protein JST00_06820 [Deltaproteobacteria bacterium]|nr:hypothetical protein [Deltaproteobacteria bacterium]
MFPPTTEAGSPEEGAVSDARGEVDGATPADASPDSGPSVPALRFVGRRDETDPQQPKFGWSGSRIIARFNGTEANVTFEETPLFTPQPNPTYWDVIVDGARTNAIALDPGVKTYSVATGLAPGVHTIELYKRTEGRVGITQLRGFAFPGGALLAPAPAPSRRIEFFSDSTSTGYGVECTSSTETFTSATQNERRGYAGLVAQELGADHHNVSISGKGIFWNLNRGEADVAKDVFVRTLQGGAADWVFTRFVPDVVWMMLGSNDYDTGNPPGPPAYDDVKNAYVALVALVRSKYPAAHIFLATAPNLNDDYPVGYAARTNVRNASAAAVAARAAAGDTKVYAYDFTRSDYPGDQTGCGFHVNLAKSRSMADEAKAQIRAKTGW